MRRVGTGLAIAVLAAAGVVGVIAFFNGRDAATTTGAGAGAAANETLAQGPGVAAPPPERDPKWRPLAARLRAGNVAVRFGDRASERALRSLADQAGAGYGDGGALAAAGQALVPVYAPDQGGITVRAYRRTLTVASTRDPRLQEFVEAWLGRPAPR